jgi:2-haloacid dehalogenase
MQFRAYLFDVQGTLLNFFSPVQTAVTQYLAAHGASDVDAAAFTRSWRQNYLERIRRVPQSREKWRRIQKEYQDGFSDVCVLHGLPEPDHAAAKAVAKSWRNLEPWPDVQAGIARIREKAITASLSNTDMSVAIGLFKRLDIGMDAIFAAEIFGAVKPELQVYKQAVTYLGLRPEETAMVASHPYDLEAAHSVGLGTIFVSRPLEYGYAAFAHDMAAESVTQHVQSIGEIE